MCESINGNRFMCVVCDESTAHVYLPIINRACQTFMQSMNEKRKTCCLSNHTRINCQAHSDEHDAINKCKIIKLKKRVDEVKYRSQCWHLWLNLNNGNKADDKAMVERAKVNFYDNTKNILVPCAGCCHVFSKLDQLTKVLFSSLPNQAMAQRCLAVHGRVPFFAFVDTIDDEDEYSYVFDLPKVE